jgi:general stress protein YciG
VPIVSESDTSRDPQGVAEAAADDREAVDEIEVPGREGGPHDEEAMRAADGLEPDETTRETYDDMLRRGAEQKGEGRLP